jgi:protein NRD1
VLIQKLYTHFRKAPATHKLGVLYVVDSVTRKWLEQAKVQGQSVSSAAPDGTYAAGVHRVTELMPVLMNDIISTAPEEQKVRSSIDHCSHAHPHLVARWIVATHHPLFCRSPR